MELHVNIDKELVQKRSLKCYKTRVGGNPESMLRFQTYLMSNLVQDEFNDADGFDEDLETTHTD